MTDLTSIYKGDFAWEFFVQAIPCYIFLVAFITRHRYIKDLGFSRRARFGWLLNMKIVLTLLIMLLRVVQIVYTT